MTVRMEYDFAKMPKGEARQRRGGTTGQERHSGRTARKKEMMFTQQTTAIHGYGIRKDNE